MTYSRRVFVSLLTMVSLICGARPNFVIILSDDMGYLDIECHRGESKPPI